MAASPSSRAAFWTWRLYRNCKGQTPTVHLCTTVDRAEECLEQFVGRSALGFDLEWKASAAESEGPKANVSIIQIACDDSILLYHLGRNPKTAARDLVPPTLKKILESPDVLKCGVSVVTDAVRLKKFLGIDAKGVFELSHLHKLVKHGNATPELVNKKLVALARLTQEHLQLPLAKGAVRTSDWSRELSPEQREYAATDAYAGLMLFRKLEEKRLRMKPTPPRPKSAELKQPILRASQA
ncbi:ribonuclease H-like domain-containing protein [Lineolata rhizophorae]|uniref:Ribonuclease H-like domain-containing protein n=1 Tax=Lineolata rhizophorae TaxID=578093 RepID=A0A6A6NTA9_9PEZI|nr:ribonuclease H-like domain-containing protein [Lineolata rhizophorae]